MRLRFVAPVVIALTASLLAACGGETEPGDDTAGETRIVESTFTGEKVEIPAEPQRVVALWRTGSELVDLGVIPVAALEQEFDEEELGDELYAKVKDVPTVGSFEGVDVEKVIAAEPDLIIGMDHGGLSIDYDELAEVAPTVVLKIAEPTDVWANYPAVAEIVGKQADFDKRNADIEAQLADLKEEFGDVVADVSATSFGAYDGTIYVDTSKSLTWQRLDLAGVDYNAEYTDSPERYATELSAENIADLADSKILFYDAGIAGKPSADTQAILDLESYQRLPAVRAGHAYPLTAGTYYTFAAAQQQVDDLRKALTAYAADAR